MIASIFIAGSIAALASAAPYHSYNMAILNRRQAALVPATVSRSVAVDTTNDADGVGAGVDTYTFFQGDGSEAAGWPAQDKWASFNEMFEANTKAMSVSCVNNKFSDTNDSPEEIAAIKSAIESVALSTKVDHRFILAIMMQESKGCVRVNTTMQV